MSLITSSEMFINMKVTPSTDSSEYEAFALEEWKKVRDGIWINGVYISGWLYWHLNHWKIQIDGQLEGERLTSTALLRDNEWLIAEGIERAEKEKKLLTIFGSRQLGKTTFSSSYLGRKATIIKNSQNLITGASKGDLTNITNDIDFGLQNVTEMFRIPRISRDWKSGEVYLGVKSKEGDNKIHSMFRIRNTEEGRNTEVGAGMRLSSALIDEAGKALRHGTRVFTKEGFSTIEKLVVGDKIYDDCGNLTTVTNIAPQGVVQIYKISLRDGRTIEACENHKWEVYDTVRKRNIILSTKKLFETNNLSQIDKRYNKIVKKQRYYIPNNKCINYEKKNLKIDPYFLGLWLGDGNSKSPSRHTSIDTETIEYLKSFSKSLGMRLKSEGKEHGMMYKGSGYKTEIYQTFKSYDLINNKHIPLDYLTSSKEDRMELLMGLMDTDGSCDLKGGVEISSSYPKLAKDIIDLIRSLGIACKVTESESCYKNSLGEKIICKNRNRIKLNTDQVVFKLSRKKELQLKTIATKKQNKKSISYRNFTSIVSIEKTVEDFATCISVDNESKLFLAGDHIVTHNSDFAKVLAALLPGLRGANGLRAPVLITGTGGDMEKSKDAEVMFFNPESNEIVEYVNEKTGRKTGLFISGLYRQDYKKQSNLAEYLGKEDSPELEQIKMLVSDKERGLADIEENRKKLAKDPDASKLLKYMMYYPLTEEEIFLSESHNVFPKELLLEQKRFLQTNAPHCDYVELYRDTNNLVKHKFTDKKPINEFPHKKANGIEGVIQIWEMPIDSAPDGIYIAANDPYKTDTSKYSDSLGSIYIFKRTYDITSDKFQNMMVAAYTGRPKKIQTWYDTAKNLLEFYNAKTLSENMDYGFIQHCIDTNCAHKYLVPQPRFLYEIHANSTVHRSYGIHMTEGIKSHIFGCIKRYMEDVLKVEKDEEGNITEVLGVRKIIDPMLIEEMIKYEPGVNVDRIIAFGLVLAYAQSLDKHPLTTQKDNRYKELARPYQRNAKNPFSSGRNPFRK